MHILQLPHPGFEVLVPIGWSLPQVEALDATVLYSLLHSLVQIRVQLLGVERRITKHIYDFLELNFGPSVKINVYHGIICMYYHVPVYHTMYL